MADEILLDNPVELNKLEEEVKMIEKSIKGMTEYDESFRSQSGLKDSSSIIISPKVD